MSLTTGKPSLFISLASDMGLVDREFLTAGDEPPIIRGIRLQECPQLCNPIAQLLRELDLLAARGTRQIEHPLASGCTRSATCLTIGGRFGTESNPESRAPAWPNSEG